MLLRGDELYIDVFIEGKYNIIELFFFSIFIINLMYFVVQFFLFFFIDTLVNKILFICYFIFTI